MLCLFHGLSYQMPKLIPHYYQFEAVESIFDHFKKKSTNPLIAMPTGTGKSVVIAEFLRRAFEAYPYQNILILTHVGKLIEQNHAKLLNMWPDAPAGIFSASLNRRDTQYPITFAGIMSIKANPLILGNIDLIIVDEAHLIGDAESTVYRKVIQTLFDQNKYLKVIGLSATCWRNGMGHLTNGGIFQDVCYDLTGREAFNRMIEEGFLSPLIPKRTATQLDITGVHKQGGDFNIAELQVAVDKFETTELILKEYLELAHDRDKWLLFCSGVEHSDHVAEALSSMGIPCEALHSKLKPDAIEDIIGRFDRGELRALANNNMLTTGYDNPSIDFMGMLRPSTSASLWVQMLGRGTRCVYAPGYDLSTYEGRMAAIAEGGKANCLVADNAGNTSRLGAINDPVIPRQKGEKKGSGSAPVRLCMKCYCYNHANASACEYCGEEFPVANKLKVQTSCAELIAKDELKVDNPPEVNVYKVDKITYQKHTSREKPDMLKASYYCGYKVFHEYVCLNHPEGGFAHKKAIKWLKARFAPMIFDGYPDVDRVLGVSHRFRIATHIRVWENKKYPEIMDVCFDGSAFGVEPVNSDVPF